MKRMSPHVYLDDGTYLVSAELLSTPRRFYPIANTTARIRRDPLWVAAGITGFAGLTTGVYGDLLYAVELAILWAVALLALVLGAGTAILHVDAAGHRNAMIVGPVWRIRALYRAMRQARLHAAGAAPPVIINHEGGGSDA